MRGWILGILLWSACAASAAPLIYLRHQATDDPHLRYMLEVLDLAIHESGVAYEPRPSQIAMVQSRALDEMHRNSGMVDVVWTMTSVERERDLLPIRIPLDRGLIGWRVALLRSEHINDMAAVYDVAGLKRFSAGQMHDWPDTTILRASGLPVVASDQYEGLFKMLAAGRFDYFPRSLIVVTGELAAHPGLQLAIEPHVLIRYPTALYFFVSRSRPALARDLENGLEKAVRDGKLQALFIKHYGPVLKQLEVGSRQVIELNNPLLPAATPLNRAELWYRPDEK